MNSFLIDSILGLGRGFTATILETEGHSYKKRGQRAVYEVGDVAPVFGNLGSLCVDAEILEKGERAVFDGRPLSLAIDLNAPGETVFGYGTACGGKLSLLLEPVRDEHKAVYMALDSALSEGRGAWLSHHLQSGELELHAERPEPAGDRYDEEIAALPKLVLFGATPLARVLIHQAEGMDFALHVVDWRPAHLDGFEPLAGVRSSEALDMLDEASFLAVLSHSLDRDLSALEAGLKANCRYIGLLASRGRRATVFEALEKRGAGAGDIERIHSPIGMDIRASTDPEIAIAILAELTRELRG